MSETKQTDSANNAITFDLSTLSTSATFVAGRECTEIDNTALNYMDALVDVKGITAGSTTPTIGQMISLYLWGSDVSLGTTAIDVLDGTDSDETLGHVSVLNSLHHVAVLHPTVQRGAILRWQHAKILGPVSGT